MTVETRITHDGWGALDLPALAERAVAAVLARHGLDPETAEVAVLATGDAEVAVLNADYRDRAGATNVLSWPAGDLAPDAPGGAPVPPAPDAFGDIALGDLALAFETCAREAEIGGKPLADHTLHLIVHGTLHLLGYDHVEDADAALMEGLETAILLQMGLRDPYEIQPGT